MYSHVFAGPNSIAQSQEVLIAQEAQVQVTRQTSTVSGQNAQKDAFQKSQQKQIRQQGEEATESNTVAKGAQNELTNVFECKEIQKRTPSRSNSRSRKESSAGKTPRSINIPKSVTSTLQRASRSIERRVTPVVSDVKRLLRDSSSSRGPVSRSYSTRNGAGCVIPSMDAVKAKSRQLWLQAKRNQREILVTLALLLLVALIVYSVLHSDPAKVRIWIQTAPNRFQTWVKNLVKK
ncbi:hypothetical protein WR25_16853 [Diploscapter pachys]|uniref:Uncharacterized protein n=1 Tax=Diploscapter pachys TaxID=2018661 RepID=A0A2A2LDN8_9BILA|nr:hypothetical protein WR25_16853 [Diploscapter pachys]